MVCVFVCLLKLWSFSQTSYSLTWGKQTMQTNMALSELCPWVMYKLVGRRRTNLMLGIPVKILWLTATCVALDWCLQYEGSRVPPLRTRVSNLPCSAEHVLIYNNGWCLSWWSARFADHVFHALLAHCKWSVSWWQLLLLPGNGESDVALN